MNSSENPPVDDGNRLGRCVNPRKVGGEPFMPYFQSIKSSLEPSEEYLSTRASIFSLVSFFYHRRMVYRGMMFLLLLGI
jgi:hypothetical protein